MIIIRTKDKTKENYDLTNYNFIEDKLIIDLLKLNSTFYLIKEYDKELLMSRIFNFKLTKKDFIGLNKEFYIALKKLTNTIKEYDDQINYVNYQFDLAINTNTFNTKIDLYDTLTKTEDNILDTNINVSELVKTYSKSIMDLNTKLITDIKY